MRDRENRRILTDTEAIQQVLNGHPEAFGVLVQRYQARLRAMGAHYVANHDDVYDLVQDTFLEAFRQIDRFDPDLEFLPWLRSLARHRTLNFLREARTRHKALTSLVLQTVQEQMTDAARRHDDSWERLQALHSCFDKLAPRHQQMIRLRYTMQVAVKDIAIQYNRSVASGSAVAHVPEEAIGFTISTSTPRIVDFGTEFGVLAHENGSAETHVYDGKVGLASRVDSASSNDAKILTRGRAAVVDASGQIHEIPYRPQQIVRSMPEASAFGIPGKRLNLADAIGGGNGFGTGQTDSAIDTSTGRLVLEFYANSWATRLAESQPMAMSHYVPVPAHDYVDGVFCPTANPKPIAVSSADHAFALSPAPSAAIHKTCPGIGDCSSIDCPPGERDDLMLDGHIYGSPLHPVILMRVNKGITFDLDAIRTDMPETRIGRFTCLCGVSSADGVTTPNARACFYVLVDGVTRFVERDVSSSSPGIPIDIQLTDSERFLTLIAVFTEITPGKPHRAMFADPSLELERAQAKNSPSGGNQASYP